MQRLVEKKDHQSFFTYGCLCISIIELNYVKIVYGLSLFSGFTAHYGSSLSSVFLLDPLNQNLCQACFRARFVCCEGYSYFMEEACKSMELTFFVLTYIAG